MSDVIMNVWYDTSTAWHDNVWGPIHAQTKEASDRWREKGIPFIMVSGKATFEINDSVRESVCLPLRTALHGHYGSGE